MPKANPKFTNYCVACGGVFTVSRARELNQKYCSRKCKNDHEAVHGREAARVEATEFSCKHCGKPFSMKPSNVRAYIKKFGKLPLYCSMPCSAEGRKTDNAIRQTFTCEQCNKTVPRRAYSATGRVKYYSQQRFCSQKCKVDWQMAHAAERFLSGEIGRHVKRGGYVWLAVPANLNGGVKGEILEHRWVMQNHLGRKLFPEETVHHVNGDRGDNRLENLELFSSRHGPGQRVIDKIAFAIEMIRLYPDFAAKAGVKLIDIERNG